jgi:hypothetical protein
MAYLIVFPVVCECGERQKVKFQSIEEKLEKLSTTPCKACGETKLYTEKAICHRTIVCNSQECDYEESMFFDNFDDYSVKIKTMECPKCKGKLGTYYKDVPVQYLADGFTNAYSQSSFKTKSPASQRRLDAALRENDALQHMAEHDPKFIKAKDQVKRLEDLNNDNQ